MAVNNPFAAELDRRTNPFAAELARREDAPQAPGMATGVARAAGQGVTFGFADEGEAGVRALFDRNEGEDYLTAYERIRNGIRSSNQAFREENPVISTGAEIAGALLVPGLGTVGAAGRTIAAGGSLAAKSMRAAGIGAIEGAIYGAGTANEISDIPGSAARGAAFGGALGAAAPAVIGGVSAAAGAVKGAFKPSEAARRRLALAIERDGLDVSTIRQRLRLENASGRPATLADVGGENVRRELERVVQSPGAGAQQAVAFLSSRNKDQINRISRDLVSMTGIKGDDVADVIESTMKARATAAAPVYERAMQFHAELNDDIVDAYRSLVATPLGKQAIQKAKKILNVSEFDSAPLMDRIDAVKKGMDDLIGEAMRKGEKQVARRAIEVKNKLIGLVDTANPDYRKAREIWQDGQTYLDAIDEGRSILSPKLTAAEAKRKFASLSDADREAWRIGAVDSIITRMRQQSANEPNLIRLLRSPEIRDKLVTMMTPKQARRFERMVDMEDSMFRVSAQARANSATAQRTATREEAEKQMRAIEAIWSVLELVTGGARQAIMKGLTWMPRRARDTLMARQNEVLAGNLVSRDPRISALLSQPIPMSPVGPVGALATAGAQPLAVGE